jgi:hypothetical protein
MGLTISASRPSGNDKRRMTDDDADWRLAIFHAETAEGRPCRSLGEASLADEAVCCLRGAIRFHLPSAQLQLPSTQPGHLISLVLGRAVVVPLDRWHRFELDEPTDLLAVTVRRGTQLLPCGRT